MVIESYFPESGLQGYAVLIVQLLHVGDPQVVSSELLIKILNDELNSGFAYFLLTRF